MNIRLGIITANPCRECSPYIYLHILHRQLITYSRWWRLTRKCDWPWFNCEHLNNRHCVKGVAETASSVYRRFDSVLATERVYTVKSAQIVPTKLLDLSHYSSNFVELIRTQCLAKLIHSKTTVTQRIWLKGLVIIKRNDEHMSYSLALDCRLDISCPFLKSSPVGIYFGVRKTVRFFQTD